jgi:hypothetical protein
MQFCNSVSPTSFNYSDSSIINNYILKSELQNGIINIDSNLLTEFNLLNLNPTNGTNEQKKLNRNNLVLNMFIANKNVEKNFIKAFKDKCFFKLNHTFTPKNCII